MSDSVAKYPHLVAAPSSNAAGTYPKDVYSSDLFAKNPK